MIQKILPNNGKVLIIDDKYDDVKPIQNIFAENGIPYIFYDYTVFKDIPVKKLDAVRMMFLDIRLEDGMPETKNIATVLASVIEKVIMPQNGPYILVLWTNEIALKDEIQEYLFGYLSPDETTLPTYVCALDKKDFVSKPETELVDKLISQLSGQNMMKFLIEWENASNCVSGNMIRLMLYGLRSKLDNDSIEKILVQLACMEDSEVKDQKLATRNVIQFLVELVRDRYLDIMSQEELINTLSEYWTFAFGDAEAVERIRKDIPIEQKASMNSVLNLTTYDSSERNLPGKVYLLDESKLKFSLDDFLCSTLGDKWYQGNEVKVDDDVIKLNLTPIEVDITPNCDYAQNKNHMLRTVFGYMIEIGKVSNNGKEGWRNIGYSNKFRRKISREYVYVTPEFLVDEKLCVFVFNTKYLTIEKKDYCAEYTYLLRLNGEILGEIRKKSGEIISRLGINNL